MKKKKIINVSIIESKKEKKCFFNKKQITFLTEFNR